MERAIDNSKKCRIRGRKSLVTVQVLVALCLNNEHVSLQEAPKELLLVLAITIGLIVGLIQQRQVIVECEDVYVRENVPVLSWTVVTLFMLGIAMFVGISSVVNWCMVSKKSLSVVPGSRK